MRLRRARSFEHRYRIQSPCDLTSGHLPLLI
jgi:hypothetical protein